MRHPATLMLAAVTAVALAAGGLAGAAKAGDNDSLPGAIGIDREAGTVTLPLLKGQHDGETAWYVVTESSNKKDARVRGVNHSAKLANALGSEAVQEATVTEGVVNFDGTVDFSPERIVEPGPNGFPPDEFQAGAVGDAEYSPLITTNGRTVLNASQVANSSGLHDAVVDIDRKNRQVTLDTLGGFYEGDELQYLHQEGSVELVAAIEGSTFAPNLDDAPGVGSNDKDTSARSAIIPVVNGERGEENPDRQGLQSALLGEGDPMNITQTIPGDNEYSPVWDVTPAVWTDQAIADGERRLLTDADDVADLFEEGPITSGGAGPRNAGLEGIRALPGISNCPVVAVF